MAAGGDGPDHLRRVGDVDVVIDDDDKFAAVGAGARAGGDEQSLF